MMSRTLQQVYEDLERREQECREEFLATYPTLSETQIAALNKSIGSPAEVRRWRREGRIFVVPHQGIDRYPAFQFMKGQPKRVIAQVLEHLSPSDPAARTNFELEPPFSDWAIAFWFVAANPWLDDGLPIDLIDVDPTAVVRAASHARDLTSD
jgi:hypothetical protein